MELYRITKKEMQMSIKYARKTACLTGRSMLYHLLDCCFCVVRYGCGPSQYLEGGFYKLRAFDRNNTYTKKRSYKIQNLFNKKQFRNICSNKMEFNKHFSDFVNRQWLYCKCASLEDISSFVSNNSRIICKPIDSSRGKGIYELDKSESLSSISQKLVGEDVLLEEMIVQHPDMCFGNKSVNTLRITTIMDNAGNIHILKANLRCGVGNSIVDNYCMGGVTYPINIEHGIVEGAGDSSMNGLEVYIHPLTDICMLGRKIPFWEDVLSLCKEAAKTIPQLRFIGWDVAITEDGPQLIEGNVRPGAQLLEYAGLKRGFYKTILQYK